MWIFTNNMWMFENLWFNIQTTCGYKFTFLHLKLHSIFVLLGCFFCWSVFLLNESTWYNYSCWVTCIFICLLKKISTSHDLETVLFVYGEVLCQLLVETFNCSVSTLFHLRKMDTNVFASGLTTIKFNGDKLI
jgi:hypothetical protein